MKAFILEVSKFTGQYLPNCDTTVLPHLMHNVLIYNNLIENTGWMDCSEQFSEICQIT